MIPRIVFEPETFVDIMLTAINCDVEVSGLAKVKQDGELYTVYGDIEMFNQDCSMGGTHLNPLSVNSWIQKVKNQEIESGVNESQISLFRLWWHSHVFSRLGQVRPM